MSSPHHQTETYGVRVAALILVPLFALVLQAYLPLYFRSLGILDLPLLVIIYLGLGRRSPMMGLLAGAVIGLAQDGLSRGPIGLFGITKTIIGYVTYLFSGRVDTENPGIRLITIFSLYYLHSLCAYLLGILLLENEAGPDLVRNLIAALVNAVVGVLLFMLLDRFRKPT